jgi:hypothetical protein
VGGVGVGMGIGAGMGSRVGVCVGLGISIGIGVGVGVGVAVADVEMVEDPAGAGMVSAKTADVIAKQRNVSAPMPMHLRSSIQPARKEGNACLVPSTAFVPPAEPTLLLHGKTCWCDLRSFHFIAYAHTACLVVRLQ